MNMSRRNHACFVDVEGCREQDAAFGRRRQMKRQSKALSFSSKGLVKTIVLSIGLFIALSGSTEQGFSCTLAFTFASWRTTGTSSSCAIHTQESCRSQRCPILGRIRNERNGCQCGYTKVNSSGRQIVLQQREGGSALFSTTEKSINGGTTTASLVSSSQKTPCIVTTNATNTTESQTAIQSNPKDSRQVPRHVGLICDGNGRWAAQRNLPRAAGHLEGARRLVDLIRSLLKERKRADTKTVDCITLYAFSTENWDRSPLEISKIFEAIEAAAIAVQSAVELSEIDLKVLGDLSDDRIPQSLKNVLVNLKKRTESRREDSDENRLQVCLAINYGGRRDIVSACRSLAEDLRDGRIESKDITEDALQKKLSTGGIPPPDLIVRTGGEHRLSNFLLWESAYAELCVSQVLWPDFSWEGEWTKSLDWYSKRKRNFGGRKE